MTIEELLEEKTIYLTVVVPQGRNNNVGHAVTIVDNLILIPHKNMHKNFASNPLNGPVVSIKSKIYILLLSLNKMPMYPL